MSKTRTGKKDVVLKGNGADARERRDLLKRLKTMDSHKMSRPMGPSSSFFWLMERRDQVATKIGSKHF